MLSQQEIEFANLRHVSLQANTQNLSPKVGRERPMRMRNDAGAEAPGLPGNPGQYRVDPVGRRPGHQSDEKGAGAFGLRQTLHAYFVPAKHHRLLSVRMNISPSAAAREALVGSPTELVAKTSN